MQSSTKLQLTTSSGGKEGEIEHGGLGGDDTNGDGGDGDDGGGFAPQFLGKPRIQFVDSESLLILCDMLGTYSPLIFLYYMTGPLGC